MEARRNHDGKWTCADPQGRSNPAYLDKVAFVRFASVYRDFSHVDDFEKILADVSAKIARDPGVDR